MSDTTSAAPSDAEIDAQWRESVEKHETTAAFVRDFARAVLARWGAPPAVAPWRSAVLDLIDECPGLTMEQDRWMSRRVKELDFASTPHPTQAQAGAAPMTEELIDAMEQLMGWQVKNVDRWHNRAYDYAHHVLAKFKAAHGIGTEKGDSHGLPT